MIYLKIVELALNNNHSLTQDKTIEYFMGFNHNL